MTATQEQFSAALVAANDRVWIGVSRYGGRNEGLRRVHHITPTHAEIGNGLFVRVGNGKRRKR